MNYEPGGLVKSLAGHDKDRYFIILAESKEYVTLADGKYRAVEKPKQKKKKHVQAVKRTDEVLNRKLTDKTPVTNEEIRASIQSYERDRCGI